DLYLDGIFYGRDTTNSYTKDDGAMILEGGLGVEKNINLGGNLKQDDATDEAELGKTLIFNETESNSKDDGSLVVEGGVGIEKNINLGGNLKQDDATDEAELGKTLIFNETESNSKDDGALVVEGGVGIEKNLNLGGNLIQDDATDKAELGETIVYNTTESNSKDEGALIVEGGLGVEGNINAGGNLTVQGDLIASGLIIDGKRQGPDDDINSYPVQLTGKEQGIAIKIDKETPTAENNFITFFDEDNDAVGRIEGQSKVDILESETWIIETAFLTAAVASSIASIGTDIAVNTTDLGVQTGRLVTDGVNQVLAIVGAIGGAIEGGAGVLDAICVAVIAVLDLTYGAIELANSAISDFVATSIGLLDLTTNVANLIQYEVLVFKNSGSTFSSGSADYAEWLPRANALEHFSSGDVVGIIDGKITKSYEDAAQFMVISSDPFMLGNMPSEHEESNYEMVAFMGQVPIKVMGTVASGDYLIASLEHPGMAEAVKPSNITVQQCERIVGTAWGSSDYISILSMLPLD
ncbi:MAG: hypothetical protein AAGK97_06170, partial [Bacteroidota bacterium]